MRAYLFAMAVLAAISTGAAAQAPTMWTLKVGDIVPLPRGTDVPIKVPDIKNKFGMEFRQANKHKCSSGEAGRYEVADIFEDDYVLNYFGIDAGYPSTCPESMRTSLSREALRRHVEWNMFHSEQKKRAKARQQ